MGKTLVIAEKPSVGRDLTKALPGAFAKHEGYLESDTHVVTWAVGHLVQLAEPDEMPDRPGDDVRVGLEVALVLGERPGKGLRQVPPDGRLLGDDECLAHFAA